MTKVHPNGAGGKSFSMGPYQLPPPSAPVVGPLPNVAYSNSLKKGSSTVFIRKKAIAKKNKSYFGISFGDEVSTPTPKKGVITGKVKVEQREGRGQRRRKSNHKAQMEIRYTITGKKGRTKYFFRTGGKDEPDGPDLDGTPEKWYSLWVVRPPGLVFCFAKRPNNTLNPARFARWTHKRCAFVCRLA